MYKSLDIAKRIKDLAKMKKIPLKELFADAGLSVSTTANMKTSVPKADNLARIADRLGCSVDYLLGRDDEAAENEDAAVALFAQLKPEYQDIVLNQVRQLLELQKTEQDKK